MTGPAPNILCGALGHVRFCVAMGGNNRALVSGKQQGVGLSEKTEDRTSNLMVNNRALDSGKQQRVGLLTWVKTTERWTQGNNRG